MQSSEDPNSITLSTFTTNLFSTLASSSNLAVSAEFWANPNAREKILKENNNNGYLVIQGKEPQDHYPKSIWVIAATNTLHQNFDKEIDVLQGAELITSNHNTDIFQENSFKDYATQIILDNKTLTFLVENEFNNDYFIPQRAEYQAYQKTRSEKEYRQFIKDTFTSVFSTEPKLQQMSDIDLVEHDLSKQSYGSGRIIVFSPDAGELQTLQSKLKALSVAGSIFLLADKEKDELLFYGHFTGERWNGNILCIPLFSRNEAGKIINEDINIENLKLLNLPLENIDQYKNAFQKLVDAYKQQLDQALAVVHQDHLKKNEVILTVANAFNPNSPRELQEGVGMPFYQCQASFYLQDAMALGLKEKLNQLIQVPDVMRLQTDEILTMAGLYTSDGDISQYFANNKENVCPAWEYGIFVTESDQKVKDLYSLTRNAGIDKTDTLVKISVPALALLLLLNHYEKDVNKNPATLKNAAELIKQHYLIVPKKYQSVLLQPEYFSPGEIKHIQSQYAKAYVRQKEIRMPIAQKRQMRFHVLPELQTKKSPTASFDVKIIKITRISTNKPELK